MSTSTDAQTVKTTDIVGYFNGNKYPLNINSNALGLNLTLGPGTYLKDRSGRYINDPRIAEQHLCDIGGLTRELSKVGKVPINALVTPSDLPPPPTPAGGSTNRTGVSGFAVTAAPLHPHVPPAADGRKTVTPSPTRDQLKQVAAEANLAVQNSGAVKAMTIEDFNRVAAEANRQTRGQQPSNPQGSPGVKPGAPAAPTPAAQAAPPPAVPVPSADALAGRLPSELATPDLGPYSDLPDPATTVAPPPTPAAPGAVPGSKTRTWSKAT